MYVGGAYSKLWLRGEGLIRRGRLSREGGLMELLR